MAKPLTWRRHGACDRCGAGSGRPCWSLNFRAGVRVPVRWDAHPGRPLRRPRQDRTVVVERYLELLELAPDLGHRQLAAALGMTPDAMRLALTRSGRWRDGKVYTPGLRSGAPRG